MKQLYPAQATIVEVRCPVHGLLYEQSSAFPSIPPIDARKLRDGTIDGTCKPCLRDGVQKPHTHLLWATAPDGEQEDA